MEGNSVVIRFASGDVVKGTAGRVDHANKIFDLAEIKSNGKQVPRKASFRDIDAVFFVKSLDGISRHAWAEYSFREASRRDDGTPIGFLKLGTTKVIKKLRKRLDNRSGNFWEPIQRDDTISRIYFPNGRSLNTAGEKRLGEILVSQGMISREDLGDGLEQQEQFRERRIGGILLDKGMVSSSEISKAIKIQQSQGHQRVGEILVAAGAITSEQLESALEEQRKDRSKRLGEVLVEMKLIDDEMLALALAMRHQLPYVHLKEYPIDPLATNCISPEVAKKYNIVPLELRRNELTVAFSDPVNLQAKTEIAFHTGLKIKEVIASQQGIKNAITQYYEANIEADIDSLFSQGVEVEEVKTPQAEGYDISEHMGKERPVIALVNHILKTAVDKKASDVHIVPEDKEFKVRFRVDGVLHEERSFPAKLLPSVITRIKILSNMNIAERRLPQDGRAKIRLNAKIVDLRFSCLPTVCGESAVIRVLDKEVGLRELDQMGFLPQEMQALRMLIAKSYGMILFTGPTGSGKTSTIYACLKEPVFSQKNIITLEDPVEYELTGMCQVQIMDSIGLTFARGLRQVLRHDPDVVVVGEMRDSETAKIGVQAALTGHLLISTLHTNTVSEAFARLIDLGVEPFLIASSVLGVASQRLLRKICPHCKELDPKGAEKLRMIHLPFEFSQDISFHKGRGCDECNNTGYKGRTIVYDLLVVNEEIKRAVVTGESSPKIKSLAVKRGMRSIEMIAFEKVKQGITSVDEIIPLVSDITQQS